MANLDGDWLRRLLLRRFFVGIKFSGDRGVEHLRLIHT